MILGSFPNLFVYFKIFMTGTVNTRISLKHFEKVKHFASFFNAYQTFKQQFYVSATASNLILWQWRVTLQFEMCKLSVRKHITFIKMDIKNNYFMVLRV